MARERFQGLGQSPLRLSSDSTAAAPLLVPRGTFTAEQLARLSPKDRAYVEACLEHGIEPELPEFRIESARTAENSDLDVGERGRMNGRGLGHRSPVAEDEPAALPDAGLEALELILGVVLDSAGLRGERIFKSIGQKVFCLAWLLGRGPHAASSLRELAPRLKMTRAALSWHVRQLEEALGVHGRGQKPVSARPSYRAARRRYVARLRAAGLDHVLKENRRGRKPPPQLPEAAVDDQRSAVRG